MKDKAEQNIIFEDSPITSPKDIIINNVNTIHNKKRVNLTQNINNIVMKWDNKANNCTNMFRDLVTITKIDLSKFDTSEVSTFELMFQGCESITSINLDNLDTSKVENMRNMFYQCKSLKKYRESIRYKLYVF